MKNPAVIISVIILTIGIGAYFLTQQSTQQPGVNEQPNSQQDSMVKDETTSRNTVSTTGKYVVYTKQILDTAANKRRVLYFYANWCPICIPADADFRKNENKIPADVVVIRVNYNDTETDQEEKDLAKKYGITYQHTFVQIDAQGNVITKWNGGQTNELLENIK
ncbi:MAG: thioredoxin family protein [Candidatus Levybacteria bacterium]|nr:thioredoxin family protein [Candidatus Levybacteria bacterium]